MSADSKRRQELLKQIAARAQVVNISLLERLKEAIFSPSKWDIVDKTTTLSAQVETQKFVLCFDYLNEAECHYVEFDSAKGKALVALLKQVTSCEVNAFPATRIVRDTVSNTGEYQSLFRSLSPDVNQLQEAEIGDGRVFFFIIGNKFNIVSIESNHRNTNR